jgi:replicative DNA helicase
MAEYKFGLDFQRNILAAFLEDKESLLSGGEVLRPEFFGEETLSGIAEAAIEFARKHHEAPSKETLLHEIESRVAPGRKLHEYVEELEAVWQQVGTNGEYYRSKAGEFAKAQAVARALQEAVPLLEVGELGEIERTIRSAIELGERAHQNGVYDYFENAKERTLSYLKSRQEENRVPTGFYPLDEVMGGGLAPGEMGVVVALPKHGKTTTLVNMGASALLQNKSVVYFTLELSKRMIAGKFDSRLFGMTREEIKTDHIKFARAIVALREKILGRLYISEHPTKSITVDQMGAYVRKIKDVGLVLVDYGQLIRASSRRDDRRHEVTEVYESLRRMAGELSVPVWAAHQANRPGTGAKVLQAEHIAEDFNVIAIADIGVSVNQSDEERRKGKSRLAIMGSRIGPSGEVIPLRTNWKTSTMTVENEEETFE